MDINDMSLSQQDLPTLWMLRINYLQIWTDTLQFETSNQKYPTSRFDPCVRTDLFVKIKNLQTPPSLLTMQPLFPNLQT